jgi:hypothetical protein
VSQRLARLDGPRPGPSGCRTCATTSLPAWSRLSARRCAVCGPATGSRPVLLRQRALRAVPSRPHADLRRRLPARLQRIGLIRRAGGDSRCRPPLRPPARRRGLRRGGGAGVPLHDRLRGGGGAWSRRTRRLAGGARLARGALGGDARQGAARQVTEPTGGRAHVSIDALGSAVTCAGSIHCLRKRGRHLQVGPARGRRSRATGADRAGHLPRARGRRGARDGRVPLPRAAAPRGLRSPATRSPHQARSALTDGGARGHGTRRGRGHHRHQPLLSRAPQLAPDAHEVPLQPEQRASRDCPSRRPDWTTRSRPSVLTLHLHSGRASVSAQYGCERPSETT